MRNMNVSKFFISAVIVMLVWCQSCVKVPLEALFPSEITTSEEDIQSFSDRIRDELKQVDIATLAQGKAPNIPACKTAFEAFVDKTTDQGLIPYRLIKQTDYASTVVTFCPDINMVAEIRRSILEESKKEKNEKTLIDLAAEAKSFTKHGCSGPIIDPGRGKFELSFLKSMVQKNSLNTHSVPTEIFYSTKLLTEEEIDTKSAVNALINDGTLRTFGIIDEVNAKETGLHTITITIEGEKYREAIKYMLSLKYSLVAIPVYEKYKPYIMEIGKEKFYVVPQGELVSKLGVDFVVEFSGKDAQCLLTEQNEKHSD